MRHEYVQGILMTLGQEMLSLSGTTNFTHSLYIQYILLNLSGLGPCLQINNYGLFAWISLAVLSRDLFYLKLLL